MALIKEGTFRLDKMETGKLEGNYKIKIIKNESTLTVDEIYESANIPTQAVYLIGNVLVRDNTDNIEELIKLFIKYTHDPCEGLDAKILNKREVMVGGTICPTKKTLFIYKSKVFVAYGRYIFGFDKPYVAFKRIGQSNDDEDIEEEYYDYEAGTKVDEKITEDEIVLTVPEFNYLSTEEDYNEYVYSFMIYDEETKIIDAFGLYR